MWRLGPSGAREPPGTSPEPSRAKGGRLGRDKGGKGATRNIVFIQKDVIRILLDLGTSERHRESLSIIYNNVTRPRIIVLLAFEDMRRGERMDAEEGNTELVIKCDFSSHQKIP